MRAEFLERPAEPVDLAVVKLECEKALMSFQRGSYNKAIRLMKESCSRHPHSALIYRVQGTLWVKVASVFEDLAAKQRYLRNAVESARKAVELSPNSIEFGHLYANLLYEAANDGRDSIEFDEVLQECQRALTIENPIDPAKESLQDENQQKILTPDARIVHVQEELKSLVQKSNLASLTTWMKISVCCCRIDCKYGAKVNGNLKNCVCIAYETLRASDKELFKYRSDSKVEIGVSSHNLEEGDEVQVGDSYETGVFSMKRKGT